MSKNEGVIIVSRDDENNVAPRSFNLDRIEKPNCNVCQCEHRDFAEDLFDSQKKKNYSEIKRRLKVDHDFDATSRGIKNHMLYHYQVMSRNLSLQEYSEDIDKWTSMQGSRVSSLKRRIAMLERSMFMIAQESDESIDIAERRKSAETVKKLAETILTYEDKLAEYLEDAKPITIVFNHLQVIVNEELENVNESKTKKVVSTILSRLKTSVGDMTA